MSLKLNKTMSGLTPPTASTPGVLGEIGANVNSVIVIGFAEFEVYGKLNGSWEQIGTSFFPDLELDSLFPDLELDSVLADEDGDGWTYGGSMDGFTAPGPYEISPVTTKPGKTTIDLTKYEDVYFVSKSGKEETMRFFFVEDAIVSPTSFSKASKLEDISDMPVFTQEDAGKILSVDAQGNLAWITR